MTKDQITKVNQIVHPKADIIEFQLGDSILRYGLYRQDPIDQWNEQEFQKIRKAINTLVDAIRHGRIGVRKSGDVKEITELKPE